MLIRVLIGVWRPIRGWKVLYPGERREAGMCGVRGEKVEGLIDRGGRKMSIDCTRIGRRFGNQRK